MKAIGFGVLWLIGIVAIAWFFAVSGRPLAKFGEETRRQVYEESVTAKTACQKELLRLYGEAQKGGISPNRRRALELEAKNEYNRTRCSGVSYEVQNWMEAIQ